MTNAQDIFALFNMIILGQYINFGCENMVYGKNLQKIDDFSAFLSLIGLILAIQSTQLDKERTLPTHLQADKIITVSVFISACSNFIDLSIAKLAYDQITEQKEKVHPKQLSAAKDLLTSRVFSTIAAIYLIRATLKSTSKDIQESAIPTST